jgi:hypothetical protein
MAICGEPFEIQEYTPIRRVRKLIRDNMLLTQSPNGTTSEIESD